MSNSERPGPPPNPNATIQLSALDAADLVQFDNAEADEGAAAGAHGRVAPPPLPPVLPQVSAPVATAAPSRGVVFYGAVFVVFLVVAVGAGLAVGETLQGFAAQDGVDMTDLTADSESFSNGTMTLYDAGLAVGSYARSRATPVASSAPPVVAPAQVPTAAASAAPHTLVIPTVEVSSP